jgi:hypothetical protein
VASMMRVRVSVATSTTAFLLEVGRSHDRS